MGTPRLSFLPRLLLTFFSFRSPEQHWGLMPLHAICSTVTPTYHMYGGGMSYGGPNAMSFPQSVVLPPTILIDSLTPFILRWLGQNSKQNKLARQLGDVQIRMRLKVSGDKTEIRQSYIPAMFPHIIQPLMDTGTVCTSFLTSFWTVSDRESRHRVP